MSAPSGLMHVDISNYSQETFSSIFNVPENQRQTDLFPPANNNGGLVVNQRYTLYHTDGQGAVKADNVKRYVPGERRIQSLPDRDRQHDGYVRHINSAPSNKAARQTRGIPSPKRNNFVNKGALDPIEQNKQVPAGVTTLNQHINQQDTSKFASSWAEKRAEFAHIRQDLQSKHVKNEPGSNATSPTKSDRPFDSPRHHEISPREKKVNKVENDSHRIENSQKKEDMGGKTINKETKIDDQNFTNGSEQKSQFYVSKSSVFKPKSEVNSNVKEEQKPEQSNKTENLKRDQKVRIAKAKPSINQTTQQSVPDKEHQNPIIERKPHTYIVTPLKQRHNRRQSFRNNRKAKRRKSDEDKDVIYDTKQMLEIYNATSKRPETRDVQSSKSSRKSQASSHKTQQKVRSNIPPWHRNGYTLSRREASMYMQMNSVYENASFKKQRRKTFYNKLESVQVEAIKAEQQNEKENAKRRKESQERQARQLASVRQRFSDEQMHRFKTQYVTSRVLESEKENRFMFGLPEVEYEDSTSKNGSDEKTEQAKPKEKRTKKVHKKPMDAEKLRTNNKIKFDNLFKAPRGPRWDVSSTPPRMEGIDTVVIDHTDSEGNTKATKRDVQDIIREAKEVSGVSSPDKPKPKKHDVKDLIKEADRVTGTSSTDKPKSKKRDVKNLIKEANRVTGTSSTDTTKTKKHGVQELRKKSIKSSRPTPKENTKSIKQNERKISNDAEKEAKTSSAEKPKPVDHDVQLAVQKSEKVSRISSTELTDLDRISLTSPLLRDDVSVDSFDIDKVSDDDDDDIFERARKKYQLDIDSDDDD